jgi:TatA/E family protein of Tat protein translocase
LPQIGPLEILVILVVALVVFGPSKLPDIGRQVGRGVREFRKFQQGFRDDIEGAFGGHDDDHDDDHDEDDQPRQIEAGKSDHPRRHEPPPADTTS